MGIADQHWLMQAAVLLHGASLNQDGRSSSLTAPSGPAQQSLIRSGLQASHMPPSRVWGLLYPLSCMQQIRSEEIFFTHMECV